MKSDGGVQKAQKLIDEGKTDVEGQITNYGVGFGLKGLLTSGTMAEQFIGSYRLDIYTSNDCESRCNIISDSKNRKSLLYRLPVQNVDRGHPSTKNYGTGNTYQFYIWKTPIKE